MKVKEIKEFIVKNKTRGFDELADMLGVSKAIVKKARNELGLPFKVVPRTMITIKSSKKYKGKTLYRINEDFAVYITPTSPIFVPKNLDTDLGSVPSIARWFVDKDHPDFLIGFIVHDLLYEIQLCSRALADQILYDLSKELGAGFIRRWVVYKMVRWFGGFVRRKHGSNKKIAKKSCLLTIKYFEKHKKKIIKVLNKIF